MREKSSTLRALSGLAGAVAGSAAIICSTSLGQAAVGCWLRPPQASLSPGVVAPATNGAAAPPPKPPPARPPGAAPAGGAAGAGNTGINAVVSCSWVIEPDFCVSAASYHASNAVFTSAAVTLPSLSASNAANSDVASGDGAAPPRPPAPACAPGGA